MLPTSNPRVPSVCPEGFALGPRSISLVRPWLTMAGIASTTDRLARALPMPGPGVQLPWFAVMGVALRPSPRPILAGLVYGTPRSCDLLIRPVVCNLHRQSFLVGRRRASCGQFLYGPFGCFLPMAMSGGCSRSRLSHPPGSLFPEATASSRQALSQVPSVSPSWDMSLATPSGQLLCLPHWRVALSLRQE